jgi:hypothetical protein
MKKVLLLIALVIGVPVIGNAQIQKEYIPKNLFKINLTSLVLNNYMGQYERVLGKRVSIAFSYRNMPESTIPFKDLILNQIKDNEGNDAEEILNNLKIKNYALTPEIRFYFGQKGYGRGFYIAPFFRYSRFDGSNLKFNYEIESDPNEHEIVLKGDITGQTVGVLLGAQWALGKNICLDWWLIGPHFGLGKGNFYGTSSETLTEEMQNEIRNSLEDIDIPMYKKTVSVNASGASMTLDGYMAGIRAGISLGIKF